MRRYFGPAENDLVHTVRLVLTHTDKYSAWNNNLCLIWFSTKKFMSSTGVCNRDLRWVHRHFPFTRWKQPSSVRLTVHILYWSLRNILSQDIKLTQWYFSLMRSLLLHRIFLTYFWHWKWKSRQISKVSPHISPLFIFNWNLGTHTKVLQSRHYSLPERTVHTHPLRSNCFC